MNKEINDMLLKELKMGLFQVIYFEYSNSNNHK